MSNKKTYIKSKLFNLKKWLLVPEVARYLSILFGEEVTEADVLRLGLDGHLKLSVNFVNHAKAKCGDKFLPIEEWEAKFREIASWQNANFLASIDGMIAFYFLGFDMAFYLKDDDLVKENRPRHIGHDDKLKSSFLNKMTLEEQNRLLTSMIENAIANTRKQSEKFQGKVPPSAHSFRGNILTIKGVWDLPMLGTERLDIEHEFQMLTGGPEVTLQGLDGAFVEREDGVIFQLQERFPNKDSIQNSDKLNDIEKKIVDAGTITKERLLEKKKERANRPFNHPDNYYPAGGLPRDSVLVVRTQALIDFQERLSQSKSKKGLPLDGRAETTYLNIIGAMIETFIHQSHGNVDFPSEAKLREFLGKKYAGFKGLTERTLAEKFSAAKKVIREEFD
jgi:hypothetical protein